jgi:hypothetical protein
MDQGELEGSARWFTGVGCVFSDDFAQKHVGAARMKQLDLAGSYVWRFDRPTPCTFVSFGAGGTWTLDLPITKQYTVSRTEAEMSRVGKFVNALDPSSKYIARTWCYHLDLKDGGCRQMRRPTDEEVAQLQLDFREEKRQTLTGPYKPLKRETVAGERMARELRALDRRRMRDANLLPPKDRRSEVLVKALKDGPRRMPKFGKRKLDVYRSDTDEEEVKTWNDQPPPPPPSYGVLFGEGEDEEEEEKESSEEEADVRSEDEKPEDSELADLGDTLFAEPVEGDVVVKAPPVDEEDEPPPKKKQRRTTAASASTAPGKILERVLRAMRVRSRRLSRPR